ncbi:MAG: bifunctional pyr operon transcriptional regulator/uracil phosphoribosyltransferase PyrR [Candidatus Margulisiibacteriota bacterium]|nr:MAG: hypothetical protein A2X43_04330 [Candidatus Margulisbacteria bacterium GWD2_39_127]OGI05225.1 MAG: hypothetical protein A2X42_02840 [Candidatus Margulisbacteria bacterium GWF2_38_17]OGI06274.1 MAG: hypothetical protein A2X41_08420 [Candidatus Margulisbacteria bacterium GWE2_39_32]PZM78931.1 MAG: bifunctional pyr operon transcriptional regulator/uracil phosphoribosyltransferase PyrR [Candidatus Margulisiibacteriota bacterium]HAR64484.1 bifunctional pyr operon transcriptional regulator/u
MQSKAGAKVILTKRNVNNVINRLAHEIIESIPDYQNVAFIGIVSGGIPIAEKTAAAIKRFEGISIPIGQLDVSFYRDDLQIKKEQVAVRETSIPCDLHQKDVILFDNVICSGRTIRAAMDALLDWGRPKSIKLAVLIDREHREFPIQANFVGKKIATERNDLVVTNFEESENVVILIENQKK